MKPSQLHTFKALYAECIQQSADKDQLIALQQQQLLQMVKERELNHSMLLDQQQMITTQQQQLQDKDEELALQQHTIVNQAAQLSQQDIILEEQNIIITSQQKQLDKNERALCQLDQVRHELRLLKRWIYGIKSEKRHAAKEDEQGNKIVDPQLSLSLDADSWGICRISDRKLIPAHIRVNKTTETKKSGGRNDLPEGLEEEIIVMDVADKPANARLFRYEEQRQLACDPLRWYIKVIRRPVYLVADEDELSFKQLIAPLPSHPIPRCKVDISVLVMLLTDKYLYHLPTWRQRQRFLQYGIELPYSTLSWLTTRTCDVLEPLWHLLLKEISISGHVHMDETTFKVLDDTKKKGKKSHLGWMWAMMNPVQRIACFLYQPGRGKKDIKSVLKGYEGYLLTDAYASYTKYGRQPGVIHQQCMAHVRRYFITALENDAPRATYALDHFFAPLYAIEAECKLLELDYDSITEKRQSTSLPILMAFRQWLEQELPKTTARTPIHKAIAHALNHFDGLLVYISDGMLSIDNNNLEGQIRSLAVGRRNFLFAGSHRGGERAAIIYSLMATCKLQGINPIKWLDDVLRRIPSQPKDKLLELLPQFWKPLTETATTPAA
jgi:transposase